ncbi:MAG: hypothetical protein RR234_07210 [Christensenella sp.]
MFIDNLEKECAKQGLKITPLVVECGGSKGSISAWRKGTIPNSEIIVNLAVRLNVSCDYLLLGKISKPTQNEYSILEQELLNNFNKLDNRGKHKIHTTVYEELDRMTAASAQEQRELNEIFKLASSPNVPVNTENTTTNLNALFGQTTKKG